MSIKIVTPDRVVSGTEPLLAPIIEYLKSRGIQPGEVREVVLTATVGEPLILDVRLFVQAKP